ncbi:Pentatricopeptide repeat-containing protein [Nymphaea thermarum]|nr:Pentatricopeptide repeat-containing protein [Nymphaea thermarum]
MAFCTPAAIVVRFEVKPIKDSIVITICFTLAALEQGRQIHAKIIKVGNINLRFSMYSNCGCILESEQVFREIMVHKDIVSWNALILGLVQNGCSRKALETADTILDIANHNTFIAILTSCSHGGLVDDGLKYFGLMNSRTSLKPILDHYICVIDMLGRAGRVSEA